MLCENEYCAKLKMNVHYCVRANVGKECVLYTHPVITTYAGVLAVLFC